MLILAGTEGVLVLLEYETVDADPMIDWNSFQVLTVGDGDAECEPGHPGFACTIDTCVSFGFCSAYAFHEFTHVGCN